MNDDRHVDDLRSEDRDSGCQRCADVLEAYVELELVGEIPARAYPGVATHLRSCARCLIQHDGLLDAARHFGGIKPD